MNYHYFGQNRSKTRVFISFDYDHDAFLREAIIEQAKNDSSPFEIADWSLQEALPGNWQAKVRERIRKVDVVAVICGWYTDKAAGVSAEVRIAQEEKKAYFLLAGRKEGVCKKPEAAKYYDKMYKWSWDNLELLIESQR